MFVFLVSVAVPTVTVGKVISVSGQKARQART